MSAPLRHARAAPRRRRIAALVRHGHFPRPDGVASAHLPLPLSPVSGGLPRSDPPQTPRIRANNQSRSPHRAVRRRAHASPISPLAPESLESRLRATGRDLTITVPAAVSRRTSAVLDQEDEASTAAAIEGSVSAHLGERRLDRRPRPYPTLAARLGTLSLCGLPAQEGGTVQFQVLR